MNQRRNRKTHLHTSMLAQTMCLIPSMQYQIAFKKDEQKFTQATFDHLALFYFSIMNYLPVGKTNLLDQKTYHIQIK